MYRLSTVLVIALLGISVSSTAAKAEQKALTEHLDQVILKSDGTWHYAQDTEAPPVNPITCNIDNTKSFLCNPKGCQAISLKQQYFDLIDEERQTISLCSSDEGCNQYSAIFTRNGAYTDMPFRANAFVRMSNSNFVAEAAGVRPLEFLEVTGGGMGVMVRFGMCSRDMEQP